MQNKDLIKVLENALAKLKNMPLDSEVIGSSDEGGYTDGSRSMDLDLNITYDGDDDIIEVVMEIAYQD